MVFGIGVMLVVLGALQAGGVGAKIKDNGFSATSQSDKDLAIIGRIISVILIVAAGIYLLCI